MTNLKTQYSTASRFIIYLEKGSCGKCIRPNQNFFAKICFCACILKLARSTSGFALMICSFSAKQRLHIFALQRYGAASSMTLHWIW